LRDRLLDFLMTRLNVVEAKWGEVGLFRSMPKEQSIAVVTFPNDALLSQIQCYDDLTSKHKIKRAYLPSLR